MSIYSLFYQIFIATNLIIAGILEHLEQVFAFFIIIEYILNPEY